MSEEKEAGNRIQAKPHGLTGLAGLYSDAKTALLLFLIIFIPLKLIFYKEAFLPVLYLDLFLLTIMIIPGYLLMNIALRKAGAGEKIVIGSIVMLGIAGVGSYLLGLILGNYRYYFVLHALLLVMLIYFNYFSRGKRADDC